MAAAKNPKIKWLKFDVTRYSKHARRYISEVASAVALGRTGVQEEQAAYLAAKNAAHCAIALLEEMGK